MTTITRHSVARHSLDRSRSRVVNRRPSSLPRQSSWDYRSSDVTCSVYRFPWTEEIARLLSVWLMCVGGILALTPGNTPRHRTAALFRRTTRAIDHGLRLVLLGFFLCLVVPAWQPDGRQRSERLPASGLSGCGDFGGPAGRSAVDVAVWCISSIATASPCGATERCCVVAGSRWSRHRLSAACRSWPARRRSSSYRRASWSTAALGVPLAFTLALTH